MDGGENEGVKLPSKIRGYKDMIAITSFGNGRCSVWIPITSVEKFSAILIVLSCIIPVLGPLVAGIITGLLGMVERGFRSIFSVFGWCDGNDEIETKRKEVSKDLVVEVDPQPPSNESYAHFGNALYPSGVPNPLPDPTNQARNREEPKIVNSPGASPTPTNEPTSPGNSLRP